MSYTAELSCTAEPASLASLLTFLKRGCAEAGLDEATTLAVRLAGEEACTNVIRHGYAGEPGPVSLSLRCDAAAVTLVIEDRAPLFRPEQVPAPDLSADWERRAIGGLGWHLIRQTMDEIRHQPRPGGGNRLELVKYRPAATMNNPGGS